MYFLIIFIISYLFLPSDLLPSILRHASNCHVALCPKPPNHFFCRCLTKVNKHPFSPAYKALQNSFICQCSCPINMLYILIHGHIPNTSNLCKMYKSVFSHHTMAYSTPAMFIIIFFVLSEPLVSNHFLLANASLTIAILVLISLSRFIHLFLVSFRNTWYKCKFESNIYHLHTVHVTSLHINIYIIYMEYFFGILNKLYTILSSSLNKIWLQCEWRILFD